MPTSDGITDADWDVLKDIAWEMFHALQQDCDDSLLRQRLFVTLDRFERKYGRLPSLLITRADFTEDDDLPERLLKEAFVTAEELGDVEGQVSAIDSLARHYLSINREASLINFWLDRMEKLLEDLDDDDFGYSLAQMRSDVSP